MVQPIGTSRTDIERICKLCKHRNLPIPFRDLLHWTCLWNFWFGNGEFQSLHRMKSSKQQKYTSMIWQTRWISIRGGQVKKWGKLPQKEKLIVTFHHLESCQVRKEPNFVQTTLIASSETRKISRLWLKWQQLSSFNGLKIWEDVKTRWEYC